MYYHPADLLSDRYTNQVILRGIGLQEVIVLNFELLDRDLSSFLRPSTYCSAGTRAYLVLVCHWI